MQQRILFAFFVFLVGSSFGQQQNRRSLSEIGPLLGGMYYIGDLNPYGHFRDTRFAGGLVYRYNYHSRVSFRVSAMAGSVRADDARNREAILQNRNLNFQSRMYELSGGVEFHYFPFQLGHDRYKGTAYLGAAIGLFHMNPTTTYNGNTVELQGIGTEGQGTALSTKNYYSKTQLTVPLIMGAKLSLGENVGLTLEYGLRKTFTDYLDDVGSGRYIDPVALEALNGPMAAALSNRSINGDRFGRRGNPNTRDWYAFFGAMLTIRMGKPNKCYNH